LSSLAYDAPPVWKLLRGRFNSIWKSGILICLSGKWGSEGVKLRGVLASARGSSGVTERRIQWFDRRRNREVRFLRFRGSVKNPEGLCRRFALLEFN
jgi:hypothetical protein